MDNDDEIEEEKTEGIQIIGAEPVTAAIEKLDKNQLTVSEPPEKGPHLETGELPMHWSEPVGEESSEIEDDVGEQNEFEEDDILLSSGATDKDIESARIKDDFNYEGNYSEIASEKDISEDELSDDQIIEPAESWHDLAPDEVSWRGEDIDWHQDFERRVKKPRGEKPRRDRPDARKARGGNARGRRLDQTKSIPVLTRIVSGLIMGAFTAGCLLIGPVATVVFICVLAAICCVEFFGTLTKVGFRPATFLTLIGVIAAIISAYLKGPDGLIATTGIFVIFCFLWYLPTGSNIKKERPLSNISTSLLGFLWIGFLASFGAMIIAPSKFPNRDGLAFILGALLITVFNDIGSFTFGSYFRKKGFTIHDLAPNISPQKSWEGFVGGTIFSLLSAAFLGNAMHPWTQAHALILAAIISVVAPLGDLCESLIKRDLKIKDLGTLLPGHGGIIDRVDAILFVLPATYYFLLTLHLT
jgi:CDP-diglyceride synthetase